MSGPVDPAAVADAVAHVRDRIAAAGGREVELVAVTKTFGADAIRAALAAGCEGIGENYAQEAVAKLRELPGGVPLHVIGPVQTNKVRLLAPYARVWETVDRPALVDELARRVPGAVVLVQVNATGEATKSGAAPDEVEPLVARARAAGLEVVGLMAIGPTDAPPEAARPGFRLVRRLADDLGLARCSMGMSHDLEIAVEEGATSVRVGTALFGPRSARGRGGGIP